MFDEQNNPQSAEPEDIFANAEAAPAGENLNLKSALANKRLRPVAVEGGALPEPLSEILPLKPGAEISQPLLSKKGIFLALGGVVIIALIVGTGWVLLRLPKKSPALLPAVAPAPVVVPVSEPTPAPAEIIPPVEEPLLGIQVKPAIDTDEDGLMDEEEATVGTSAQNPDTDSDGLTDYEEIMVWKTNALNPDTDGDGYPDGSEIKNGYNPNGQGKLLEIPSL